MFLWRDVPSSQFLTDRSILMDHLMHGLCSYYLRKSISTQCNLIKPLSIMFDTIHLNSFVCWSKCLILNFFTHSPKKGSRMLSPCSWANIFLLVQTFSSLLTFEFIMRVVNLCINWSNKKLIYIEENNWQYSPHFSTVCHFDTTVDR